jgi:hypothetical protein
MPTSNRCNPAADVGCCGEFHLRGHKDYAVTGSKHPLYQQPSYNPPFQINFFSEHNHSENITNMAAQGPEEPLVDTSPISPIRPNHVRQNSLEKHLQSRPNPQELKDRHILLNTNAAP